MQYLSRTKIVDFLKSYWPPIAIALFVIGLHWDLAFWAIPATGDHMIHLYRGWLMSNELLPSGRLTGWSNMAFAGYPAGVFYPILGDTLIAIFRYLTFGLLSWERTYAIAFLGLLVAMPLAVYAITRRATGRRGAMVAAVLSLGDVGGWPQGGHFSTVLWAVWPFMLGLTITMFSVRACENVLTSSFKEAPGRFFFFALLLALSVLGHPMSSFFLVLACPLFVVSFVIARHKQTDWPFAVGRAALAAGLAVCLTLFWIIPWATAGEEWTHGWPSVGFGGLWMSIPEMCSKLLENELFKAFHWVAWVLGLAGIVIGLVSRRLWPTFFAILLIITFFTAGACYELGDGIIARKVQIERMAAFMKFIWFALAGVAVDRAGFGLLWLANRSPEKWRSKPYWKKMIKAGRLLAGPALVVFIIAISWTESFGKVHQIGRLGGPIWKNIVKAELWLGEQPRGPLDRVLYQPGKLCTTGRLSSLECDEVYHRHIFASGPTRTNLPKLRFGYEATAIFRNLPLRHRWPADTLLIKRMLTEPIAFENLHVRWIVSVVPWPSRPDIKEIKRFGSIIVYSVEAGKGPPIKLEGPGDMEVLNFEDEEIKVRIVGAGSETKIHYPIAHFYPWHAYHDGQQLEITKHGVLPKTHEVLMTVPAHNGVTTLKYERPLHERVAGWVSLFAWIGFFAAITGVAIRRRRMKAR
jgi:hypothetical protein